MKNLQAIKYASFAVSGLVVLAFFFNILVAPPKNFPVNTTATVESGKAITFIARDLYDGGLIKSPLTFKLLAVLFAGDGHIVAGDYFFDKPISAWKLVWRLARGDQRLEIIKITFPEGFTVEDIAKHILRSIPDFDRDNFLNLAADQEGYLFPDTYFFYPNYRAKKVIEVMTKNFQKRMAPYEDEIKASGHTLHEIITMASLIERESGGIEDKVPISSILWKRIGIDLALQVDAAPATYDHRGLPAEPIANPGLDSILAALRPEETPYLFYIHAPDGTAYYAKDFEEHKVNRVKYLDE